MEFGCVSVGCLGPDCVGRAGIGAAWIGDPCAEGAAPPWAAGAPWGLT
jgi:hypothetical protein